MSGCEGAKGVNVRTVLILLAVAALIVGQWSHGQGYSTKVHYAANGDSLVIDTGGTIEVNGTGVVNVNSGTVNISGSATFKVSAIAEYTAGSGVAIDGITLKDGLARSNNGAGAIVTTNGLSLAEYGSGLIHQTVFTLASVDYPIVDSGANGGHGSLQLYDFPEGKVLILGTTNDLTFTAASTNGLTATATYDFGVGSAATGTGDAVLSSTEQDLVTKIEGDLVASVATPQAIYSTAVALDGTTTPADAFLNAAFEAADISADEEGTATGTVTVTWINLGDY